MRFTNLDMDALRSFVSGIEGGSFAKAADLLGRSTSAVSAQLKKLEEQTGAELVRRSGRGLMLTEEGELFLPYARRLLTLNDEAVTALQNPTLQGWLRLGIQEDFGESLLPQVLGRFARSHPKVRIEGRIGRNSELRDKIDAGHLDLALAWDDGSTKINAERIAMLPLCWLGPSLEEPRWLAESGEPLPLAVLEAPCLFRNLACNQLDRAGIAWRIAFVSPSLGGLWAATSAGLGTALRTPFGCPTSVRPFKSTQLGLPDLPTLGLSLLWPAKPDNTIGTHIATIIRQALSDALPEAWVSSPQQEDDDLGVETLGVVAERR